MPVEFNVVKMVSLIRRDMFLAFVMAQMRHNSPNMGTEDILRTIFNTYVLGDSATEREYLLTH